MRDSSFALSLALITIGCATVVRQVSDEPKSIRVGDQTFHYTDEGSGEPLVFVHGSLGDYRNSRRIRATLARKYRVISYSRRYHYPNQWTDAGENYSREVHAQDLAAFIRALGLDSAHLAGNSYGGSVIVLTAIRTPEVVRSLIVGEPGIRSIVVVDEKQRSIVEERQRRVSRISEILENEGELAAIRALYDEFEGYEGAFEAAPQARRDRWIMNAKTVGPQLRAPELILACEDISRIRVPTTVLTGDLTTEFYQTTTKAFVQCLAAPSTITIKKSRHAIFTATRQVSKAIQDHMRKFRKLP